jgi:hypothetical protein
MNKIACATWNNRAEQKILEFNITLKSETKKNLMCHVTQKKVIQEESLVFYISLNNYQNLI